ncbi:MAG: pantetheine-phosphate adenylyltransferase [candidate division Zixibacteria bacterium]|nr:pantetheine-phosphate adenylyltransferase [candidate division Zixibacteria bacterium]
MSDKLKKIAVYPGTFDPITNGHISLIDRALHIFDEVIVSVARASTKSPLLTCEERLAIVQESLEGKEGVRVEIFDSLLAEYASNVGATAILRGLRAVSDFEFEFQMALMNRRLQKEVETVFLMPALSYVYLSSTIVKEVVRNGGDVTNLIPEPARLALIKKFGL